MKTHIAPRLKKALLASMSILALSLTCSSALADNENYDRKNVDGDDFRYNSLIDSSWVEASAVGTKFAGANLTNANFTRANLENAAFVSMEDPPAILSGANFTDANLTNAYFSGTNLTDADLENATIQGASFEHIVGNDSAANPRHTVTHAMLMSTKSWSDKDFSGVSLAYGDLSGLKFTNFNLTGAVFFSANLSGAVLTNANIQGANFGRIVGNDSAVNPRHTVTHAMLMSTKSWSDKDFSGVSLAYGDLSGLKFTNFNLTGANFEESNLQNANLSGAVIKDVSFTSANLSGTNFANSDLTNANFSGADLSNANLSGAIIKGAYLGGLVGNDSEANPKHTVTHAMLMSTNSYQVDHDFSNVNFYQADLNGFNFSGMKLQSTVFYGSNLSLAQFTSADLRGADMRNVMGFNANDHNNLINTDGKILNLTLSSASDSLTIRGGTSTNAFLDGTTATISGSATLTLTENAVLELRNSTQLTLADDGHLNLVFDTTDPSSLTSIVIEAGSSLTLDPGAILDITISDLSVAGFEVNILSWKDDADVADLLTRLEDGTAYLINGYTLGELGLYAVIDHDNNTFSIIPEPSTATLSLLALAGLLARRRRKAA